MSEAGTVPRVRDDDGGVDGHSERRPSPLKRRGVQNTRMIDHVPKLGGWDL